MNVFNYVILSRKRQLPDDDRMIETCRWIFKSFNVNNLSVCIGWCADQVTLRSARCNDKNNNCIYYKYFADMKGTIYGNRLPRGTQVKKKIGNSCSLVCKLAAKVHHRHVIRRNKPQCFEVSSSFSITFGLSIPSNPAKPVCYTQ